MQHVSYTSSVETRKGTRIWIEGEALNRSGFAPGTSISIAYDFDNREIVITPDENSSRTVTNASRNGNPRPIIDMQNKKVDELFPVGTRVVVMYQKGLIQIRAKRFNTGHAHCFARISTVGFYQSLYSSIFSNDGYEGSLGSVQFKKPPLTSAPYDPFAHDPEHSNPFYDYKVENIFETNSGFDSALVCYATTIGYHSLMSFGDSCKEFDIGSVTGSNDDMYNPSINASAVNRSIIDQGNSINIINLAGTAIKTDKRSE